NEFGDRGDPGEVRYISRGEYERRLLAVQIGQFALELDQRVIVAGDVAGAAGAGAHAGRCLHHGPGHARMLPHAAIIVGTPHHDLARPARRMPDRVWEASGDAFQLDEYAVASLVMKATEGVGKVLAIGHERPPDRM